MRQCSSVPSPCFAYLLQLMMTSSGWILFFSMPCLGCSPLPLNRPGGSILKLPMRSLWWSSRQKPYSSLIFSLASFKTYRTNNKTTVMHIKFVKAKQRNKKTSWILNQNDWQSIPVSLLCSGFSWLPPWQRASRGSLQSYTSPNL